MRLPRRRLPGSSDECLGSRDITKGLIAERLQNRGAEQVRFLVLGTEQTLLHSLQLHHEPGDVDAVAYRISFVGGMRLLEEIGDVVQYVFLAEGEVFLEDRVFFVPFWKIDGNLR